MLQAAGAEVIGEARLVRAAFDPGRKIARRIGGDLGAEQVDRRAEPEIDIALQGRQIDRAGVAHRRGIVGAELLHHLERALDNPGDPAGADEHVKGFFGQHEPAAARQRVERALGEALQLKPAVAVGEIGEHEKAEPIGDRLVEGPENPRLVVVSRMARQQLLGFFAAVAAKIGVQQIDHRPEMPAFFDIDLEEVAQIVERGTGAAEPALLLDRGRLGVALRHDQPAQARPMLARHLLPHRLADRIAKTDAPIGHRVGEKDPPPVFRHGDVAIARPAVLVGCRGGAQIHVGSPKRARPHFPPPVEKSRLPLFESALQRAVVGEADIVRDPLVIVDRHPLPQLYPLPVEPRPRAAAVALQRALLAGRVRTRKDPVLPSRKPAEYLGRDGLGAGEAQIRLHPGQRVGR